MYSVCLDLWTLNSNVMRSDRRTSALSFAHSIENRITLNVNTHTIFILFCCLFIEHSRRCLRLILSPSWIFLYFCRLFGRDSYTIHKCRRTKINYCIDFTNIVWKKNVFFLFFASKKCKLWIFRLIFKFWIVGP